MSNISIAGSLHGAGNVCQIRGIRSFVLKGIVRAFILPGIQRTDGIPVLIRIKNTVLLAGNAYAGNFRIQGKKIVQKICSGSYDRSRVLYTAQGISVGKRRIVRHRSVKYRLCRNIRSAAVNDCGTDRRGAYIQSNILHSISLSLTGGRHGIEPGDDILLDRRGQIQEIHKCSVDAHDIYAVRSIFLRLCQHFS